MSPQWAAFVGLTATVLLAFLFLAHRSKEHLRDPPTEAVTRRPTTVDPGVASSPPPIRTDVPVIRIESLSTPAVLANVAFTQAVVGAVLLGGIVAFEIPAWALGLGAEAISARKVWWGLGLGVWLWLLNEGGARLVDAAGIRYDEGLRELLAPDNVSGWALLLIVVLPIIAAVEELLFRAAAIGVVTAAVDVSPWLMVVVSSVAFAFGHGAQGRAGIVVTGVLGIALAAGYVLSGSLLTVFVAHYLINALEFLVHEGPNWPG